MDITQILVTWLIVASSLMIVAQLPLGVEIDDYRKAIISAGVFGLLNAFLLPVLKLVFAIPNLLTLGLLSSVFAFVLNVAIFAIAAYLVPGFELRKGIWSAVLGALALSVVTSLASTFVYGLA